MKNKSKECHLQVLQILVLFEKLIVGKPYNEGMAEVHATFAILFETVLKAHTTNNIELETYCQEHEKAFAETMKRLREKLRK